MADHRRAATSICPGSQTNLETRKRRIVAAARNSRVSLGLGNFDAGATRRSKEWCLAICSYRLPDEEGHKIVAEIDKDLTNHTITEIERLLMGQ
jgi:hypothetical protein